MLSKNQTGSFLRKRLIISKSNLKEIVFSRIPIEHKKLEMKLKGLNNYKKRKNHLFIEQILDLIV